MTTVVKRRRWGNEGEPNARIDGNAMIDGGADLRPCRNHRSSCSMQEPHMHAMHHVGAYVVLAWLPWLFFFNRLSMTPFIT